MLLGGRAGVGKTSIAYVMSALLRAAGVAHCHIEGDVLDAVYPKPTDDPYGSGLTERNLGHLAGEYRRLGHTRFIYVNTVSVIEPDLVCRAIGDVGHLIPVLLEADDTAVTDRLASRERGTELARHLTRGPQMATLLAEKASPDVHRLDVTDTTVADAAARVLHLTGWLQPSPAQA